MFRPVLRTSSGISVQISYKERCNENLRFLLYLTLPIPYMSIIDLLHVSAHLDHYQGDVWEINDRKLGASSPSPSSKRICCFWFLWPNKEIWCNKRRLSVLCLHEWLVRGVSGQSWRKHQVAIVTYYDTWRWWCGISQKKTTEVP